VLVYDIKAPFNEALEVLLDPKSGALDKVRAINKLRKLVPVINSLPEPTIENTRQPGSHILIGIRDRFFKHLKNLSSRLGTLRAIINGFIIIYDTDFYRSFIDWWMHEIKKSDWPPMGPMQPDHHYGDNTE
jgi:hypothetical protein